MDKLLFNVTFDDNANARLFASTFTKYAFSIRRTTSSERAGLNKSRNFAAKPPTPKKGRSGFDLKLCHVPGR